MMAGIRGRDTRPELIVRRYLHAAGLRYRMHDRTLPGRPDLVMPRHKAVVYVNGCFWHQHEGCRFAYMPKSHEDFWRAKLGGNADRDARDQEAARQLGWRVFVIWECSITTADLSVLEAAIRQHL